MVIPAYLDDLNEGVILLDAEGYVVGMNRVAGGMLGLEPTPKRLPLISIVRDHRIEEAYLKQRVLDIERQGRQLKVRPFPQTLILTDITELKNLTENARELLAVLSHELRTPVSTMRSTLEALHYELSPEQKQRLLARAVAEGERLSRLLDDLTVDVKPPTLRRLPLKEHLERAVTLLRDTLSKYSVELSYDFPEVYVWADSDKLLQVIINLLENAAIHGPSQACIKICVDINNSFAFVRVQDAGEPLPQHVISKLFAPHSRAKLNKAKGTGLGLYIVRNIAQRWGGQAWGLALANGNEFGFSVPLPKRL